LTTIAIDCGEDPDCEKCPNPMCIHVKKCGGYCPCPLECLDYEYKKEERADGSLST